MPVLLHLDSSMDPARSRSRAITATFADTWREVSPEHTVVYRDLHADPPPHLDDAALHWPAAMWRSGEEPAEASVRTRQMFLDELMAADAVLVGAPMYNYSLASTLKAWVDHIHIPAVTTGVDPLPMAGRPAVVVTSRGASYDVGSPTEGFDHAVPVLQIVLGTALGMDVEVITTNLTLADYVPDMAPELPRAEAELAAAHAEAKAAALRLAQR
ncbi:NAD(P)H-dependent oxidoreductase [Nakamurella flavida]|uniref:FMN dependent NADH:quinone oxidoreductase n=1 Tax=Nakamurella flavida TaxID=363630 RepID=A0A938YP29_9ACTN|nr:NAD(P)H-dependent oxidoreductase [Nakamurella flavida]MBM9478106.1 NAD(P)H-dependent oxidoreductase [Nakamurella flavida]MDP9778673.1 FMN-dependent NADH-azoreductase [Nakamurella flavida]